MRIGVLLTALLLAGCAGLPPVQRPAFPEAEYRALPQVGTAEITGQAFMKTVGGDVKYAAGNEVLLNPVTSYSLAWYDIAFVQKRAPTAADPRQDQYIRRTTADGTGHFTFKNVPPGEYFVTATVIWHIPAGYGAMQQQGGSFTKRVSVKNGDHLDVVVTP